MKSNNNSLQHLLSQNHIFESLNPQDLKNLSQQSIQHTYQKGEYLVHYGDVWPYLFVIESGQIDAVKESSEGRRFILVTLLPGEVFWGVAFFHDDAYMPVMLQAQKDTIIHLWSRDSLLPILNNNGQVSWEISREMVKRMQLASNIVEDLVFFPVVGRLARFLLEHFGETTDEFVSRDLTLDEMAARIGTTREMVCRLLYKFAENGAIEIRRTEFKITDRGKLEQPASKAKG
jgi:CRP/FNR family transcriptional regulator, cyclic AMP receptor protein